MDRTHSFDNVDIQLLNDKYFETSVYDSAFEIYPKVPIY